MRMSKLYAIVTFLLLNLTSNCLALDFSKNPALMQVRLELWFVGLEGEESGISSAPIEIISDWERDEELDNLMLDL